MVTLSDSIRTETLTDYEADCLRAGFLVVINKDGTLSPPPGRPVGRGASVTHWDLIDRTLNRIRSQS